MVFKVWSVTRQKGDYDVYTIWTDSIFDLVNCLLRGSCLLWVMSTEISVDIVVDIAVDTRSIVGRHSVDSRSTVGR